VTSAFDFSIWSRQCIALSVVDDNDSFLVKFVQFITLSRDNDKGSTNTVGLRPLSRAVCFHVTILYVKPYTGFVTAAQKKRSLHVPCTLLTLSSHRIIL